MLDVNGWVQFVSTLVIFVVIGLRLSVSLEMLNAPRVSSVAMAMTVISAIATTAVVIAAGRVSLGIVLTGLWLVGWLLAFGLGRIKDHQTTVALTIICLFTMFLSNVLTVLK